MAIAVDQANLGTRDATGALGSITLTTAATAAANSFIVFVVCHFGDASFLTSVSGGGLTWTVDYAPTTTGSSFRIAFASAQAPSGLASGTVITPTFSGTTGGVLQGLGALSFTGVATSSPVDGAGTLNDGNPVTAWGPSNYTIQAGSVLIGASANDNAPTTSTQTAPSTEAFDIADFFAVGYRIESSAGAYKVDGTWAASGSVRTEQLAYLTTGGVAVTPTYRKLGLMSV